MSSNQRSAEEILATVTEPLVLPPRTDERVLTGDHMHPLVQDLLEIVRGVESELPAMPLPDDLNLYLDPPARDDPLGDVRDNVTPLLPPPDGWDNVALLLPNFRALPDLVSDDSDDGHYTDASIAA